VIEKAKLIPFDQSRLRREIKETDAKQDFELYELRKFFATWSQRVRVHTQQGNAERVQGLG